ncbi:serine hydrolase domain-containing protein [Streptomyces sp. NPDC059816]|uniref:serine hydrolase domain-containing protein n=1 Tax=Streptomyces sp. NPDC059816 TaxID=3346960 RepID=UPI003647484F
MNRTRSAAVAAALVTALVSGALAAPAVAAPVAPAASTTTAHDDLNRTALRAAIAGLPNADATSAQVRVGGDAVWRGSAGVRDLESGRAALRDGRFRAGSTTKVVTSALVLQLAAEGRIDLNAPVQRYLPDLLPSTFEPVAVRHLLTYTSGIQSADAPPKTWDEEYAGRLDTLDYRAVVAAGIAKGPAHDPGDAQRYANIHYTILGMLVEEVTGRPFAREAQRRIFGPLGMRNTYFPGSDPEIRGPHNRGYQKVRKADGTTGYVDVTRWNQYDRFAAGDMISTTADLERLMKALVRGKVAPEPQLTEMFTLPEVKDPKGASMSAGFQLFAVPGGPKVWLKTGGRHGYHTMVAVSEDRSRTLVHSVTSTDAKGPDMSATALAIGLAAFTP